LTTGVFEVYPGELDIARALCVGAFKLIDQLANPSLDDYAALIHNAKTKKSLGVIASETRDILVECLSHTFSQSWGIQRTDRFLQTFLINPVIQAGPHHRLAFDDDFSSTLAFSLRGCELIGEDSQIFFNCSTVTLEEHSHRGPAWLRFDNFPYRIFDIPRRRLSKKSIGEYRSPVGLSSDIQAWMATYIPDFYVEDRLAKQRVTASTHINNINECVYERVWRGHGIAIRSVQEKFFASYAAELLSRPTFFRRIVEDGRLSKMAKDLILLAKGPLGPFIPVGTDLFWTSVDGRVRPLTIQDNCLSSERYRMRFDLQPDVLAKHLRLGNLVPGLFVIFLIGSLLPCVRFLGGSYQTLYHEVFRDIFLKNLDGNSSEEYEVIRDISARSLVAWGHDVIKKNFWHMVAGDGQGKLFFDFTGWHKPLVEMSDNYASFTDNFRWSNLAQTLEILDAEEYSTLIRAEGGFR
jgi:hypothetical protein